MVARQRCLCRVIHTQYARSQSTSVPDSAPNLCLSASISTFSNCHSWNRLDWWIGNMSSGGIMT